MKKILLISYAFPPAWEAQSIRWYYLTRELSARGYSVDVITTRFPNEIFINERVKIFRLFPGPIEAFFSRLKNTFAEFSNLSKSEVRQRYLFKRLKSIHMLTKKILSFLLIGDYRNEWLAFALPFAKSLPIENYEILITSHEPMVDSLIGLFLKKRYKHLKWIADIADPFDAFYYPFFWKPLLKRLEKNVVKWAERIIVTNNSMREYFYEKYRLNPKKIQIITQGFDAKSFDIQFKDSNLQNHLFTLSYTGSFYKKERDPSKLFEALKELEFPLRIIIAGRNEQFIPKESHLREKILYKGFVPLFESLRIQRESHVLIHLSNRQKKQVPGKFFEYIGSGRPILCIKEKDEDETAILTETLRVGIVCKNEKDSIKEAVKRLFEAWKKGKLESFYNPDKAKLMNFSWQTQTERIIECIESLR